MFKRAAKWVFNEILSMLAAFAIAIVVILGCVYGSLYALIMKVKAQFA